MRLGLGMLAAALLGCGASAEPALGPRAAGARLPGIAADVRVSWDELGIPTISASSRNDAYRALGHVVAGERLFQMDLLRRSSAGRLAEVLGPELVPADSEQRRLGVSQAAALAVERLPANQREVLQAYTDGVNARLTSLSQLPFEFGVLDYRPEPWRLEDSLLIVLGMVQLLGASPELERSRTVLRHTLPEQVAAFLLDGSDRFTRALWSDSAAVAELPPVPHAQLAALGASAAPAAAPVLSRTAGLAPRGSNAWAISGAHSKDGRAILANDMHLDLGVPNSWYRVELQYPEVQLSGLVLAGVPVISVGSNRHLAWGLTALDADLLDLVPVELDREDNTRYRSGTGLRSFALRDEVIHVRGQAHVSLRVQETEWGPLASEPLLGKPVALRWAASDGGAVDLGLLSLDRARTLEEGVAIFRSSGSPPCNAVLASADGRVGWAVTGRMPRRRGFDGAVSVAWHEAVGWDGFYAPVELPAQLDPPSGLVINANQRLTATGGTTALAHDFAHGYRAFRIRQLLSAGARDEAASFALQLDTRSELYDFYRDLALEALASARPPRAELERALRAWDGRAEADSVGLGLLSAFRVALAEALFSTWLAQARAAQPGFQLELPDIDTPLERALEPRARAESPAPVGDWNGFLLSVLERSALAWQSEHPDLLPDARWGAESRVLMRHPLGAQPELASLLNMPEEPLPGCGFCVRMAAGTLGASERLVVSPGHEQDGILHMPGGQSGNPQSPHYRDQQSAWLHGQALPLLPGTARESVTFRP